MTKEEKIIDILKSYSTYTDRSREDECVHESNFYLIAKDITKQLSIATVGCSLPTKEEIYVSHSNDGGDDVYCAFTDHSKGLKDCEKTGTLLTRITLYRG